jgi:hypothetical protein
MPHNLIPIHKVDETCFQTRRGGISNLVYVILHPPMFILVKYRVQELSGLESA